VPVYFFDSSALVKRFARETGTAWVINLFKPASGNRIYIARITYVEVISAIVRRVKVTPYVHWMEQKPLPDFAAHSIKTS
jgi:predicted nucleic acid-binding protein